MSLSTFTCTVKSSYSYSLIRPFNWTSVPVPVYKRRRRINFLLDSATEGGDLPRSAGCDWTFFRFAKQATNKLASGQRNPCRMMKNMDNFVALYTPYLCFTFITNSVHASPPAYWLSSTNLCCSSFGSKTAAGTVDHAQIA